MFLPSVLAIVMRCTSWTGRRRSLPFLKKWPGANLGKSLGAKRAPFLKFSYIAAHSRAVALYCRMPNVEYEKVQGCCACVARTGQRRRPQEVRTLQLTRLATRLPHSLNCRVESNAIVCRCKCALAQIAECLFRICPASQDAPLVPSAHRFLSW